MAMLRMLTLVSGLAETLAVAGCLGSSSTLGGGGGSTTLSGATFSIAWPARSRETIVGPGSALSGSVTFPGATVSGKDLTVNFDRDLSKLSAYVGTYSLNQDVLRTSKTASFTFYGGAGEHGAVVGTGWPQCS